MDTYYPLDGSAQPTHTLYALKDASGAFKKKLEGELTNTKNQLNHMTGVLSGTSALSQPDPLLKFFHLLKRDCKYLLAYAHTHEGLPPQSALDTKFAEVLAAYNHRADKDSQVGSVIALSALHDQCVYHLCTMQNMKVALTTRTELMKRVGGPSPDDNVHRPHQSHSNDEEGSRGMRELVQLIATFKDFEKIVRVVAEETASSGGGGGVTGGNTTSTTPGEAVMNSFARRQISLLRQQLLDKEALVADLQQQIAEFSDTNLTSTQQTFNQLRVQIGNFRARAEQLELEISRLHATNDGLRAALDAAADNTAELESQVHTIKTAYDRDILEMKPHYERSLRTLSAYQSEIEGMRYSLEFGTKRTLYLETKLTEHEATIDRLTTYIRTAPDREGALRREVDRAVREHERQRRINACLVAAKIKYHELALAEEAARRRMGREREEEEAEVARYRAATELRVAAVCEARERGDMRCHDLTQRLSATADTLAQTSATLRRTQRERDTGRADLRRAHKDAEERLRWAAERADRLAMRNEELEARLGATARALAETEAALTALRWDHADEVAAGRRGAAALAATEAQLLRACERAERHSLREVEVEQALLAEARRHVRTTESLRAAELEVWRLRAYNRTGSTTFSGDTQYIYDDGDLRKPLDMHVHLPAPATATATATATAATAGRPGRGRARSSSPSKRV